MHSAVLSPAGPSASAARRSPSAAQLQLTRRGRLVILCTVVVASLGAFAEIGSSPAASTDVVRHPHLATVIVSPGQTVWDIARGVSGDSDPRRVVAEIENLNSLSDAGSIRVGQPLFVPSR